MIRLDAVGPNDRKNINTTPATTSPGLPKRKVLWIIAGLALAVVGGLVLWKSVSDPPKPWLVRWRVTRYLKGQSERSDFKVDFPFPSPSQMAKPPPKKEGETEALTKGKLTDKDFDALKKEYINLESLALVLERKIAAGKAELQPDLKAKEEALAPIVSDLWDFQRAWLAEMGMDEASGASGLNSARAGLEADLRQKLDEASTYAEIYRAIGQELWVAQRLFSSGNPAHRRVGVSLALQASQIAEADAQNGWLAGRICEGYIWPHLDVADVKNPRSPFYAETLLTQCGNIFRQNEEWENMARNFEFLIAIVPQRADPARAQMGLAFEQAGDARRALHYLRAIRATNDFPWLTKRIPRLERQVKPN